MKKILSLFLAAVMIFSIAVPSFAVAAADAAQTVSLSSDDAVTSSDDVFSDIFKSISDFFNGVINSVVNFFRWLFGEDKDKGKYTITFYDSNGYSVIRTITVEEGETIPTVPIPPKSGYTFIGWTPALPSKMPSYDLNVRAVWSVNKYTLSFDSNGGSDVEPIVATFGSVINPPADPGLNGYRFVGWQVWNGSEWELTSLPATMPAYNISYKAKWEVRKTQLTFVLGNGQKDIVLEGIYGSSVLKPDDPIMEGHEFIGWDRPVPEKFPANDVTFKAVYNGLSYTVTFVDANGKKIVSYNKKYGTKIEIPTAPAKEGYDFVGWAASNGTIVSVSPFIKCDYTYYAKYSPRTYNVTWKIGSNETVDKVEYGTVVESPNFENPTGHEFSDWADQNGKTTSIPDSMPAKDLVFTAQFTPKTYTITYDTGVSVSQISQKYGTAITKPSTPTKTGYTFVGWDKTIPSTMPAENLSFTAKWQINSYTITFKDTGDVSYGSITQEYGSKITKPASPTKTGYTFIGWDKTISSTMPAENMTITALWKVNQYTLSFDTLGGSSVASITGDYGSSITVPATPVKSDYEFLGWAKSSLASSAEVVEFPATMPAESITYYAVWRGAPKTVVFNANGVSFATDDEYTTDSKHTRIIRNGESISEYVGGEYEIDGVVFPKIEKAGYEILYWSTDSSFKADMSNKIPDVLELDQNTGSVEYFAHWKKTHTITLYDGLKELKIKSAVLPEGASLSDFYVVPEKDGYTFKYWSETKGGEQANIYTKMPTKDVTYYAVWENNEYELTLDANGGTFGKDENEVEIESPFAITQKYQSTIDQKMLPKPTREGYRFLGWSKDIDTIFEKDCEEIPTKMPLDGGYYYAIWEAETYEVGFYILDKDENGKETETLWKYKTTVDEETKEVEAKSNVKYNSSDIPVPEVNPEKDGYKFMGWFDKDGNNVKDLTMPAGNISVYAKFEKTYSFKFANCEGIETITDIYGADISEALKNLAPKREGYSFNGWTGSDGKKYAINKELADAYPTMPKANLSFTAEWSVNEYSVTFVSNGGSSVAPIQQAYGTEIIAPANPTKDGHTFKFWSPAVPTTMPEGGAVCVAQWETNQYTITFENTGDSTIEPITADYNSDIKEIVKEIKKPEKYGYLFMGWTDEAGNEVELENISKMPLNGLKLIAVWGKGDFTVSFYGDEKVYKNLTFEYEDSITAPVGNPSKDGYKFIGWSQNPEATEPDADLGKCLSDTTFYAVWQANKISIQFKSLDNYNINGPIEQTCGSDHVFSDYVPAPAEKEGHTLAWKCNYGGQDDIITADDKVPCVDDGTVLEYYATWQINQYTITFENTGDSTIEPITQDYGTDITAPVDPTKEGYTFLGWDTEIPATMPAKDVTVTAEWKINSYTATFNANGGGWADGENVVTEKTVSADFGENYAAPEAPEKTGYTFVNWTPEVPETMPAANVKYTAIWEVNSYTATFQSGDGEWEDGKEVTINFEFGAAITTPETNPERTGYNFVGWADADGKVLESLGTMPAEHTTFVAVYEIINGLQYTVETYEQNTEGVWEKKNTVKHSAQWGEEVTLTPEERVGLKVDSEQSVLISDGAVEESDTVVLKVYYKRDQFSVTINGESAKYFYGSTIAEPVAPEVKEYQTFEGWFTKDEELNEVKVSFPLIVEKDIIINAKITTKEWTVNFATDGGTRIDSITNVEYGTSVYDVVKSVANPEREGYVFAGWTYTDEKGMEVILSKDTDIRMPNNNLTLSASWTKKS